MIASRPSLALLLPDGVGVRNFLVGAFAREAAREWRLEILHAIPQSLLADVAGDLLEDVTWHPLRSSGEGRVITTLRSSLGYAHMFRSRTVAMQRRLSRPVHAPTWGRWAMIHAARVIGRAAASSQGIASLDYCHQWVARREPTLDYYREIFRRSRPAMLFCSHQRPPSIVLPVLAARELGIQTATFIFSWDNLTSKGRIAAPFDHYLVWSAHMRDELRRYYPEVAPERIHIVGTPQFDPYASPGLGVTREEFCRDLGLDPARPLICYSGGDVSTCPDDARHVRLLMEMIRDGRIQRAPQVLLRPSPVDAGERYAPVLRDYPELRYAPPAWVHPEGAAWSGVIPLPADVPFLANLTRHSDLNINVASTMTLDFALHDRPVVNVAFDLSEPPPLGLPLQDMYYSFEHYRPVVELGAARIARTPAEFADHVNAYLADPSLDRENRRRLVELEVELPVGRASSRILATLGRLVQADSPIARLA
jgi:hypothetical protein